MFKWLILEIFALANFVFGKRLGWETVNVDLCALLLSVSPAGQTWSKGKSSLTTRQILNRTSRPRSSSQEQILEERRTSKFVVKISFVVIGWTPTRFYSWTLIFMDRFLRIKSVQLHSNLTLFENTWISLVDFTSSGPKSRCPKCRWRGGSD